MTPEQLERAAANRIQHMGYPDELTDAERWRRFDADAQLVAASNDVLWERVRVLEATLRYCADFLEDVTAFAPDDQETQTVSITRTAAGWRKAKAMYCAALAGGSDG